MNTYRYHVIYFVGSQVFSGFFDMPDTIAEAEKQFAKDHPAAEYLKYRQFIAGVGFPPAFATTPTFYGSLLTVFRRVLPLARFLNEPLLRGIR